MSGGRELAVMHMAAITHHGERRVESTSHQWAHLHSNPTLSIFLEHNCCCFSRNWAQPCQPRSVEGQEFPDCSSVQSTPPADVVYRSLYPLCLKRNLDPPTLCTFWAVDVSQSWSWPAWESVPQTLVHAPVKTSCHGLGVCGCLNHRANKKISHISQTQSL